MAKREKKVHRVRPDLTYEDDIHFKLAKLKLLKDLSEQKIKTLNVVSLKELKMRETDSYEDGITKKIYLSHHEA